MALPAGSSGIVSPKHNNNVQFTYNLVYSAYRLDVVTQSKEGLEVRHSFLRTHSTKKETKATPHWPYYTLTKLWSHIWCKHWYSEQRYTNPAITLSLSRHDTWSITNLDDKTIRVSRGSKSSLWGVRRALQTQHNGLMTKSKPQVSLSIDSLRFFLAHTMTYVAQQHPFFPARQVFVCCSGFFSFYLHEVFQLSATRSDSPIVGASDIGQVSA